MKKLILASVLLTVSLNVVATETCKQLEKKLTKIANQMSKDLTSLPYFGDLEVNDETCAVSKKAVIVAAKINKQADDLAAVYAQKKAQCGSTEEDDRQLFETQVFVEFLEGKMIQLDQDCSARK